MNYEKLEELYESFLAHEKFSDIEKNAEQVLQNPKLDEENRKVGNWEYNFYFWGNYLPRPISGILHTHQRYSIEMLGKRVDLDSSNAPNFRDKENYLKWLETQINN
ncbi:hypothetical protein [Acinetobacter junii]|uniref:hypothetical protein n=1 Tax=Acinetobacter junii TaxID=40215 RepID=UPI00143B0D29|nr:hypothetical protein [Acinetobacter junii]NKG34767.1 hypothetical protein [Acinetobacter junii]